MPDQPPIDLLPAHWDIGHAILQRRVPDREVWAFGSRVTGGAKPWSDLDLVVVGDTPMSFSLGAALAEDFSESDLPWRVDVIDWASTTESFRRIILRDKVVLQAAPSAASAN